MLGLTADYFILALSVCMGVVQLAASHSGLTGLLIVPNVRAGYLLGLACPTGALTWFVHVGNVGIPGDLGGVEGAEQFLLFMAGAVCATVLTAMIASLTQLRRPQHAEPEAGMEALRSATVLQLARARLAKTRQRDEGE